MVAIHRDIIFFMQNIKYNFIRFQNKGVGGSEAGKATISLQKNYHIYFSKAFYEKYALNRFNAAKLFYDANKKAIAILFATHPVKGVTFTLIVVNGTARIRLLRFFKANKIDTAIHQGHYQWKKYHIPNEGEAFIIELATREK